jgi:hypothetical protein
LAGVDLARQAIPPERQAGMSRYDQNMKKQDKPVLHLAKPGFMDPENDGPFVPPAPSTTPPGKMKPSRTPEEQDILDWIARSRGQAYVDEWAEVILKQARDIGDL